MLKRKKIGLALGSGGPRGFAHIGVLKALEANNIPIDFIAGTSSGAIIGGAYAIDKDLVKIEKFVAEMPYWNMIKSFSDVNMKSGIVKGDKFLKLLVDLVGKNRIENCVIPFTAVAANRTNGNEVTITEGFLAEAMRASSSIPILFAPFKYKDGTELIDGGVSQQIPVDIVRKMGADIVLAVNLSENTESDNPKNGLSSVHQYVLLLLNGLARANCKDADIIITPKFNQTDWLSNVTKRSSLIKEGEKAVFEILPEIIKMLKQI